MGSEDVYILGINMTKFGKHKELDTLDLASEATLAALKDAGVTMADVKQLRERFASSVTVRRTT